MLNSTVLVFAVLVGGQTDKAKVDMTSTPEEYQELVKLSVGRWSRTIDGETKISICRKVAGGHGLLLENDGYVRLMAYDSGTKQIRITSVGSSQEGFIRHGIIWQDKGKWAHRVTATTANGAKVVLTGYRTFSDDGTSTTSGTYTIDGKTKADDGTPYEYEFITKRLETANKTGK